MLFWKNTTEITFLKNTNIPKLLGRKNNKTTVSAADGIPVEAADPADSGLGSEFILRPGSHRPHLRTAGNEAVDSVRGSLSAPRRESADHYSPVKKIKLLMI